jgi:hypothetical protein
MVFCIFILEELISVDLFFGARQQRKVAFRTREAVPGSSRAVLIKGMVTTTRIARRTAGSQEENPLWFRQKEQKYPEETSAVNGQDAVR